MHEISTGHTIVLKGRTDEPDVFTSLRALIGWGILTLGMLVAMINRQRRW